MTRTVHIDANVPDSRRIEVILPDDVPTGAAELVVVVISKDSPKRSTIGDLLTSEILGMWEDRDDIGDSAEFARNLRKEAWKRAS